MSPEQLRGAAGEVDAQSDVYALGVMFYRLLAGRLPFEVGGLGLVEAAQRILGSSVTPLGEVDQALGGAIEQVALHAMNPDRGQRYPSAAAFAADLRACLEGRRPAIAIDSSHPPRTPSSPLLVAQSPDGRIVALALADGLVIALDARTGVQLASIGGAARVERLAFESDVQLRIDRGDGGIERASIPRPA